MKHIEIVFLLVLITLTRCQDNEKSNLTLLSSQIPTDTPLVFAPGIISIEDHASASITFNPEMTELFLNHRKKGKNYNIYTTKLIDGKWSKLELAPFSTNLGYLDFHPRFTLDGNRLYFGSTRPINDSATTSNTRSRLHQWYVEKDETGDWSDPILMGQPFVDAYIMGAIPSENENLYFASGTRADGEGIYYSINQDGQYASIERMDDVINTNGRSIAHPYIAPDESYLIYDSYDSDKATDPNNGDLFISFNQNGTWSESYSLGPKINTKLSETSATVSPDGKYLFFARYEEKVREDGSSYAVSKIYWMDFMNLRKKIIETYKQ
ncbi:MAG: hypothetical protein ROO71_03605 [Balneola sp.]